MADNFQKINNPDSIPAAVSTGWQQEISNGAAQRNGLDLSAPVVATATTISLPAGGPVDVNGVMFSLTSAATLTIPLTNTDYYIYLTAGSDANHLTPALTTNAGTFDASKNARYTASDERILNWVVRRNASAAYVFKMVDPQNILAQVNQKLTTISSPSFTNLSCTGFSAHTANVSVLNVSTSVTVPSVNADTVNTGHGDVECYAMDQDVQSIDSPSFSNLTILNGSVVIGTTTRGAVYTALAAVLTSVGDKCMCSGAFEYSGNVAVIAGAHRTSSTSIDVYLMNAAGIPDTTVMSSGSGTAISIAMTIGPKV